MERMARGTRLATRGRTHTQKSGRVARALRLQAACQLRLRFWPGGYVYVSGCGWHAFCFQRLWQGGNMKLKSNNVAGGPRGKAATCNVEWKEGPLAVPGKGPLPRMGWVPS